MATVVVGRSGGRRDAGQALQRREGIEDNINSTTLCTDTSAILNLGIGADDSRHMHARRRGGHCIYTLKSVRLISSWTGSRPYRCMTYTWLKLLEKTFCRIYGMVKHARRTSQPDRMGAFRGKRRQMMDVDERGWRVACTVVKCIGRGVR